MTEVIVIISHTIPPIVKQKTILLISQTGDTKKNLTFLIKVPLPNITEYALAIGAAISTNDHQPSKVKQVATTYNATIIPKVTLFFNLSFRHTIEHTADKSGFTELLLR